ncbi:MAG TPA: hypothetical protein VJ843_02625 [Candidatus Saccharimonadales bacterium]|nr:hypothetical protein [Candidatus Saccharimonadales bacterium]
MVIATKPRQKETVHHRRRAGKHQPQTKHFMKTYWPYLPMIGIAAVVNSLVGASTVASTTSTTRLQAWTNAGPAVTLAVLGLTMILAVYIVSKHALAWRRVLVRGEQFFVHHHKADFVLAAVVMVGVVVTRMV